ncbi:MAG: hypothetical protein GEU90_06355 [Gemmatimonas sp.]|nr:hypothetical protein [Gemmatimonas sp.]
MSVETYDNAVIERIRTLGRPPYRAVVKRTYDESRKAEALADTFRVFQKSLRLVPPIDWRQDPAGSRSSRYELHTLQLLDVLFHLYLVDGSLGALDRARSIGIDWIRANAPDEPRVSEFAWYDMAVGLRAPYLAFLLRASVHEGRIEPTEAALLLTSLRSHGEYLVDGANYAHGHNHGLFQDEGLFLIADYLPWLAEADEWREVASRRAIETLRATINETEAVHLEHSPAYHLVIVNLVRRLRHQTEVGGAELDDLLRRLEETAAWFVMPDGTLPELGDTDQVAAPAWVLDRIPGDTSGCRLFSESGYAVVRTPESYLIATAGYHGSGHKHADELSFVLYEAGRRIVGDSGRYGYYESDPHRVYARSSHAHNVLVVDDQSFGWKGATPYGSGILAGGEDGGWFGIVGENPLLRAQSVEHVRLFLYRPAHALVIVDDVRSDADHEYMRLLHFGVGLELDAAGDLLHLRAPGFAGALHAWAIDGGSSRRLRRGSEQPDLRGWSYSGDRQRREVTTVEFADRGRDGVYALALSLQDSPMRVRLAANEADEYRIVVDFDGRIYQLTARLGGGVLQVNEREIA